MFRSKLKGFDTPATAACLGALVCWSLGPLFIRYLTSYVDVWTQNMLRYSAACLLWLPFVLYSARKGTITKRLWLIALGPAAVNIVMQTFWAASFYYLEPTFMVLLAKTSIIWIAAFSITFFPDERGLIRSRSFWAGAVLSILGVGGVLFFKGDFGTVDIVKGIVIGLTASLLWALYTISVRIAFRKVDSRMGFGVLSIYTVAGLWVLAFVFGNPGECFEMAAWPWMATILSGLFSIGISHVLYYSAIRRIGATIPSLVLLVQPFIILAISRVVFGESINGLQGIFGVILISGSAFSILAQQNLRKSNNLTKSS